MLFLAPQAAASVLKTSGGKLHAFLSTMPSVGLHALKVQFTARLL